MKEIWKDIKGYEGRYQVSNWGRVKSLKRKGNPHDRILAAKKQNRGYVAVNLGKQTVSVHRLVANAFVPNPNGYPAVNHIDENKHNNTAENLEWCTLKQNMRAWATIHAYERAQPRKRFERVIQETLDGEFVREWENPVSIKREMGWNESGIVSCCRGTQKTAYGFKWHFAT